VGRRGGVSGGGGTITEMTIASLKEDANDPGF